MTDPGESAPSSSRHARITVIVSVAVAAAAAAAATIMLTTSGNSPAKPPTAAQASRDRGIATGRALDAASRSAQIVRHPQLRLGLLAQPADITGLAGIRYGYLTLQLTASATQLTPEPYTSPAAEETALASGRLDAAYLTPLAAIQAWQNTGGKIRIIAGAAARGTTTVSVLAVTTSYLRGHPAQVQELLKGHIQATTLLTINPAAGHTAAAAELKAMIKTTTGAPARHLAAAVASIHATSDPGATSVLALADRATAADQLKPVTDPTSIYELAPLNQLLRSAGQAAVRI